MKINRWIIIDLIKWYIHTQAHARFLACASYSFRADSVRWPCSTIGTIAQLSTAHGANTLHRIQYIVLSHYYLLALDICVHSAAHPTLYVNMLQQEVIKFQRCCNSNKWNNWLNAWRYIWTIFITFSFVPRSLSLVDTVTSICLAYFNSNADACHQIVKMWAIKCPIFKRK